MNFQANQARSYLIFPHESLNQIMKYDMKPQVYKYIFAYDWDGIHLVLNGNKLPVPFAEKNHQNIQFHAGGVFYSPEHGQ